MIKKLSRADSLLSHPRIGIIGGGFSGVMVLYHIVHSAKQPLIIHVYEERSEFAQGLAYGTKEKTHLLNVVAEDMGAFPENPQHFYEWLLKKPDKWRGIDPAFTTKIYTRNCFVPRCIYAAYLKDLLNETLQKGEENNHIIHLINSSVFDISDDLIVLDSHGEQWKSDSIILVVGHTDIKQIYQPSPSHDENILMNPWSEQSHSFWETLLKKQQSSNSQAIILGSSLSAIDMVHSLKEHHFKGKITLLSRKGEWPKVHLSSLSQCTVSFHDLPSALTALYKYLKKLKEASSPSLKWTDIVRSLRPFTNQLWQNFSDTEKQKFFKKFMSCWNRERHRIPPFSYKTLTTLEKAGRLELRSEQVRNIESNSSQIKVFLTSGETLLCDVLLNTIGFGYSLANTQNSLLKNLRNKKMIRSTSVGIGVEVDSFYRAYTYQDKAVYVMGPLLFGGRFETIAIPELRHQAKEVAFFLMKHLSDWKNSLLSIND